MLLCLASASIATVDYVGSPTMPYLIFGMVTYDGVGVGGASLTIKNENTLFTKTIVTSDDGYWQEDSSSWQTSSGYRPPIQGDDTITVTYGDQTKSFKVFDKGMGGYAVNFEALEAPPEPECTTDSDCSEGYECIDEECELIPEPEPEPTPEPTAVTKVTSNEDGSLALIEAYYGDCIDAVIQDNKLVKLWDGEIDFEGDDYNTHEEIPLKLCIKTSLDDDEYGLIPYMVIPEEEATYKYVFDDAIPKDEVNEDDPLKITLLGEDIEIVDIDDNSIVIRSGKVKDVKEGETFEGVTLDAVYDDSVKVIYNGESKVFDDDETDDIGDIQVRVTDVANDKDAEDRDSARLRVGKDIEVSIKDGDDYDDGDVYKWLIKPDYIGITNQEEYEDLEEDYKPLAEGDSITLPNDYATITFHKVTTPEVTELDIRVKDSYLKIKGDRDDSFADEYNLIYVNADGIYDGDKELIATDKVRIGESDIYIELDDTTIKIGDLVINIDMSDITYDGESYLSNDESFLTYEGIIFKNVENAIEDKKDFKVIVPDERPEVTITAEITYKEPEEEDKDKVEPVEPVEPIEPIVTPPEPKPVEPTPEPQPTPPIEEEEEEVEDKEGIFLNLVSLLAIILGALGLGWRAGYLGLVKYYWKKGEKARALKMLFTATKRAKEDYYAKK